MMSPCLKLFLFSFLFLACSLVNPMANASQIDAIIFLTDKYKILSTEDVQKYKKIYELQKKERWTDADKIIKNLQNNLLMGYVLKQRYLNSATWKTRKKEAENWMKKYSDLPFAGKIYDLGLKKGAKYNFKRPKDIDNIPAGSCSSYAPENPTDIIVNRSFPHLNKTNAAAAKKLMKRIYFAINRGKTLIAYNYINSKEAKKLFHNNDIDAAKIALAFLYFTDLRDDKALELIVPAAKRSGKLYPIANWVAGLVYWRLDDYENARKHFEDAALNPKAKPALRSASAYWAARANNKLGNDAEAKDFLILASASSRYFYGILARRSLGEDIEHSWIKPEDIVTTEEQIINKLPVKRALALFQLEMYKMAEDELLNFYVKTNELNRRALLNFTENNDLTDLAATMISITGQIENSDPTNTKIAYPAPNWKPTNGWKIEKALAYSFVRQESCFNNKAMSPAGARGLMQLMPATAKETARALGIEWSQKKLFEPAYNLELGQSYILKLAQDRFINRNLIFLAVAYNSGPGNLYKWIRRMDYKEDPLLFMESIPSKETRTFVERILGNYWIYSSLFNSTGIASLDQIINGDWPLYSPDHEFDVFLIKNHKIATQ